MVFIRFIFFIAISYKVLPTAKNSTLRHDFRLVAIVYFIVSIILSKSSLLI